MVLKPIGSGLTLKAVFPVATLSGPRQAAKSVPSHHPAKATGKPQEGPPRPCGLRNAARSAGIEDRINPIYAIHNVKQNHKPRCPSSNHQPIEQAMAGFYLKPRAHHYRLPQTINRDASLLLISGFRSDQIIKQLVAKIKQTNQKPQKFNDAVSECISADPKGGSITISSRGYSNQTSTRVNQLKILIHHN